MKYNKIALITVAGSVRIGVIIQVSNIEDKDGERTIATVLVTCHDGSESKFLVHENDLVTWDNYNSQERDQFVRNSPEAKAAFAYKDRGEIAAAAPPTPTPEPAQAAPRVTDGSDIF